MFAERVRKQASTGDGTEQKSRKRKANRSKQRQLHTTGHLTALLRKGPARAIDYGTAAKETKQLEMNYLTQMANAFRGVKSKSKLLRQ